MTDAEILAAANELARQLYLLRGYHRDEGWRFDLSTHPQEVAEWQAAVKAYDTLTDLDVTAAQAAVVAEEV